MKLKKTDAYLWGKKYKVTPCLVDQVWGDGKQFIWLAPILIRPNFYVVRIDSKTGTEGDDWPEVLEEIYDAIDDQFGRCCDQAYETGECECSHHETWPAFFDWGGCCWGDMTEKELVRFGLIEPKKRRRAGAPKINTLP